MFIVTEYAALIKMFGKKSNGYWGPTTIVI